MTEYELADLAGNYSMGALSAMSLYLTIVSAYLIVAFVAGERLKTVQTLIITVLFVSAASFFTFGTVGFFSRQVYLLNKLALLQPDASFFMDLRAIAWIAVVESLGIIAALIFMWQVRHPKTK